MAFFWIAANPGRRVTDVADALGVEVWRASKILSDLSRGRRPGAEPGPRLAQLLQAPDNKAKAVHLTERGQRLLATIRERCARETNL